MASIEAREASLRFPRAVADNETAKGTQRIAVTGASQSLALKPNQMGKFCRVSVHAAGTSLGYVQVASAPSAQALVLNQISNAGAGASDARAAPSVPAGSFVDGILDGGDTYLVWIGSAAGGFVEIYISET